MADTSIFQRQGWALWSRLALALVLGVGALAITEAGPDPTVQTGGAWPYVDALIGLLALPAVAFRHRWPIPVMLITALLASTSSVASGAAVVIAVSVCTRHRWKEMVLTGLATYTSSVIYTVLFAAKEERIATLAWAIALTALIVATGWLIGEWRRDRRNAWGNAWRMVLALLVGFLLCVAVADQGTATGYQDNDLWLVIDLLLGLVAAAFIPLRRTLPVATLVITGAIALVSATASGTFILVLVSIATGRNWRRIALAVGISLTTSFLFGVIHGIPNSVTDLILNTLSTALAIAFGLFIGARRELVNNLRAQVDTARREQEARVAQARTHERTRIAREMHDVLAHRISLVAMHSGALAFRDDLPPDQVRSTANLLHETSHQALVELREVLGVLRAQDGEQSAAPEPPQPTLADLDELISSTRESGQRLSVSLEADFMTAPNVLSRNAFRIVQESLTNARKHAPDEDVALTLAGRPGDTLTIEVRNTRPTRPPGLAVTPGSGYGLVGLRERASLSGGTLTAGPDRRGHFVVRARLPWTVEEERLT
ncbi:sensor histidine kinase [Demetria terragena]|uniref:sensor histidine kinase n=1 Tax=Demetria terragena TaxID=63959 RepID=UPI0003A04CE0|nr:histidine kinase [Demetria terragena]